MQNWHGGIQFYLEAYGELAYLEGEATVKRHNKASNNALTAGHVDYFECVGLAF